LKGYSSKAWESYWLWKAAVMVKQLQAKAKKKRKKELDNHKSYLFLKLHYLSDFKADISFFVLTSKTIKL
jgi:hypothetical protein